jgi:peptide deformylase
VVDYTLEDGATLTEKVSGYTARIFQHEIDHLDGILFIDRKEPGNLLSEKEYRQLRKRQQLPEEKPNQTTSTEGAQGP